jgi:hypothetical protein
MRTSFAWTSAVLGERMASTPSAPPSKGCSSGNARRPCRSAPSDVWSVPRPICEEWGNCGSAVRTNRKADECRKPVGSPVYRRPAVRAEVGANACPLDAGIPTRRRSCVPDRTDRTRRRCTVRRSDAGIRRSDTRPRARLVREVQPPVCRSSIVPRSSQPRAMFQRDCFG